MDAQYSYFFRLSAILEAMPDSLIIIDTHGRIVLINNQTEKLFGYERTELLGNIIEQLIPLRFHDKHKQNRNHYFSIPRTRPMGAGLELFGLHKNGHEFPIELSLSPLKTEEGVLVLAALRDVTHRKKLEEQINKQNSELRAKNIELEKINYRVQEASHLKNQFMANMSHELRTPLNGIIGFSELMYHEKVGPISDEYKEYLSDILASSHHLLQLINDVLDLAKVESGKLEFYPEQICINKLVTEVVDILRTLIAKKRIQLEIEVDPSLDKIIIDPAKLKQVLYNYVSNAIKFTPENGWVTIRVSPLSDERFYLEVIDTGIGIRQDDFDKLFIEFQQIDSCIAKNCQGTGLGLALTKRIVEAQNGQVGVKSILGRGSTFFAILPCIDCYAVTNKIIHTPKIVHTASKATNVPHILVIDDESQDRTIIVDGLLDAGYSVEIAINGTEAIYLCSQLQYSAIILDLLLPDISGWDVLRKIRAEGLNAKVPIITISVVKERASSIGYALHDFLVKPVKLYELIKSLKRAGVTPNLKIEKMGAERIL